MIQAWDHWIAPALLAFVGLMISLEKRMEVFGGFLLMAIGAKIVIEHLFQQSSF